MSVVIIDYGSGNLRSVAKAFERVAGERPVTVTDQCDRLADSSHIVLPGVGAFGDCMRGLKALPGMLDALQEQVLQRKKPFLGICVGMQMLFERGHEHGVHAGLGWLKGEVVSIPSAPGLKIPHMGWNDLHINRPHPLLSGIEDGAHAYFVHSFYARCPDDSQLLASVDYRQMLPAVVGQGTILGTQFHPEKSQETGLRLLANFLKASA